MKALVSMEGLSVSSSTGVASTNSTTREAKIENPDYRESLTAGADHEHTFEI